MLSLSTSTLLLTDEEFMEMTAKIGAVFNDYIYNKPEEGRKIRRFIADLFSKRGRVAAIRLTELSGRIGEYYVRDHQFFKNL